MDTLHALLVALIVFAALDGLYVAHRPFRALAGGFS
jgi:hypothetical protein